MTTPDQPDRRPLRDRIATGGPIRISTGGPIQLPIAPEPPSMRRELTQVDVDNAWNRGYAAGAAEGRRQRAAEVEALELLLTQAEQYARDLQDGTHPGLEALLDTARAEGRRQATEGWEREWGAQYRDDSWVQATFDREAEAVEFAASALGHRAVSRLVGPWEPAGQTQDGPR